MSWIVGFTLSHRDQRELGTKQCQRNSEELRLKMSVSVKGGLSYLSTLNLVCWATQMDFGLEAMPMDRRIIDA